MSTALWRGLQTTPQRGVSILGRESFASRLQEANMFQRIVASSMALLVLPAVSFAQGGWKGIHNASEADYQKWIDSLGKMHAIHVSAFGTGNALRFSAVAVDTPTAGWLARHNMTADAYQKAFKQNAADGYRLISVSGYTKDNT